MPLNTENLVPVKWTPAQWVQGCKEFRQYGYDPYNSVHDAFIWFRVSEWLHTQ